MRSTFFFNSFSIGASNIWPEGWIWPMEPFHSAPREAGNLGQSPPLKFRVQSPVGDAHLWGLELGG